MTTFTSSRIESGQLKTTREGRKFLVLLLSVNRILNGLVRDVSAEGRHKRVQGVAGFVSIKYCTLVKTVSNEISNSKQDPRVRAFEILHP